MKFIKDFIDGAGMSLGTLLGGIFIAVVVIAAFAIQAFSGIEFIVGLFK